MLKDMVTFNSFKAIYKRWTPWTFNVDPTAYLEIIGHVGVDGWYVVSNLQVKKEYLETGQWHWLPTVCGSKERG